MSAMPHRFNYACGRLGADHFCPEGVAELEAENARLKTTLEGLWKVLAPKSCEPEHIERTKRVMERVGPEIFDPSGVVRAWIQVAAALEARE